MKFSSLFLQYIFKLVLKLKKYLKLIIEKKP